MKTSTHACVTSTHACMTSTHACVTLTYACVTLTHACVTLSHACVLRSLAIYRPINKVPSEEDYILEAYTLPTHFILSTFAVKCPPLLHLLQRPFVDFLLLQRPFVDFHLFVLSPTLHLYCTHVNFIALLLHLLLHLYCTSIAPTLTLLHYYCTSIAPTLTLLHYNAPLLHPRYLYCTPPLYPLYLNHTALPFRALLYFHQCPVSFLLFPITPAAIVCVDICTCD